MPRFGLLSMVWSVVLRDATNGFEIMNTAVLYCTNKQTFSVLTCDTLSLCTTW